MNSAMVMLLVSCGVMLVVVAGVGGAAPVGGDARSTARGSRRIRGIIKEIASARRRGTEL